MPWWLLIIGVAAPVLLYLAALWIGRGRELFPRTLILAVGLATAECPRAERRVVGECRAACHQMIATSSSAISASCPR